MERPPVTACVLSVSKSHLPIYHTLMTPPETPLANKKWLNPHLIQEKVAP